MTIAIPNQLLIRVCQNEKDREAKNKRRKRQIAKYSVFSSLFLFLL